MRTMLLSLGLGLCLAAPAFAADAPKTVAPATSPATTDGAKPVKKVRHHKAVSDGAKTEGAKTDGGKKPGKAPKKPAEKPAEPAPAK